MILCHVCGRYFNQEDMHTIDDNGHNCCANCAKQMAASKAQMQDMFAEVDK